MLDELLEYKEYTDKKILEEVLEFNSKESASVKRKQIRLKYLNFSNGFSGIKRAMNIIAKYFLNKYDQNEEVAINALKAWAGDKYDNKGIKEIDEIAGYIRPELFSFYKLNEEKTSNNKNKLTNIEELKDKYNDKLRSFNEDIINDDSKASKAGISDFNKVTYKSIVYNMKNKPLRRNVLVCKEDVLNNVLRDDKSLTTKEKDYLLKLISVYLLNSKKNQDSVTVTLTDVYNWSLCNHKSYKLSDYRFKDGSKLIELHNNGLNIKIKLHRILLDNYYIANNEELKIIGQNTILYIDNGSRNILTSCLDNSSSDRSLL